MVTVIKCSIILFLCSEKPTVVMEARYHVVSEGGSVALKCNVVRGKPKVHVHWLHNGAKLISESVPGVTINGEP